MLINWEAPLTSTFISSFSAQGALDGHFSLHFVSFITCFFMESVSILVYCGQDFTMIWVAFAFNIFVHDLRICIWEIQLNILSFVGAKEKNQTGYRLNIFQ